MVIDDWPIRASNLLNSVPVSLVCNFIKASKKLIYVSQNYIVQNKVKNKSAHSEECHWFHLVDFLNNFYSRETIH